MATMPVPKGFYVTMVGPASGFGQWIVGDRHANVGGRRE